MSGVIRRIRVTYYRLLGVRFLGPCWLQSIEIPRSHRCIQLGREVALDRGVTLLVSSENEELRIVIGDFTYINRHAMLDASERIEIGRDCMIGPYCYLTDHDHGTEPGRLIKEQPLLGSPTIIEDGAWIGAHATILKGVRIGKGAIVGAGAVVTKDVPANSIVAGVPARQIGSRHAE